jgi:hypothetical protein
MSDPRSVKATIIKVHGGYTVTVVMTEGGNAQKFVEKVVGSYEEAETVAREFAARHGFPWHKVAVVLS